MAFGNVIPAWVVMIDVIRKEYEEKSITINEAREKLEEYYVPDRIIEYNIHKWTKKS